MKLPAWLRAGTCALPILLFVTPATAPAATAPAAKTATKSAPAKSKASAPAKKAAAPSTKKAAAPPDASVHFGRNLPGPPGSGMLPDSFVIARTGDRVVTAHGMAEAYFYAYAEDKPNNDSLGRIDFLGSMIHKDLLGLEAQRVNRPFTFEDRHVLREHADQVYSNILYQRVAVDPVHVTDEEVKHAYEYFKFEYKLRHILVTDHDRAEHLRAEILSRKITFADAVRLHSTAPDKEQGGDLGWQKAAQLGLEYAETAYTLRPGQVSRPIQSRDGWDLIECVVRRPVSPPAWEGISRLLKQQLGGMQSSRLADALQDSMATELQVKIDSTNVRWASSQFEEAMGIESQGPKNVIKLNPNVPDFVPADTARVLARWRDGQLSLGAFLEAYNRNNPLMRPNVNDFYSMRQQVIAVALEPYMSVVAIQRGLDKDPEAIALIEKKHEEIQVQHLYDDSVSSKVWVTSEERRKYYDEHKHLYVTYPKVTFAAIVRGSRAGIDSVAARIAAGETPAAILKADSLAGRTSGSIQERSASQQGTDYYKVLFEELRPGRNTIIGPDQAGDFVLIHLITRDDGRQLSFQESEHYVDESMQNIKAEAMLNAFLERLARRHHVDWRPDLVMRVNLDLPS